MIETEYYVIDLPQILRYKSQAAAEDRLMALQIATVSQGVSKDVYERFVESLRSGLDEGSSGQETEKLDRGGLAALRSRVERGR